MKLNLIDSHCHPQFPQYDADREEVIRRSLDAGTGILCVGTDPETSRQAVKLAETHEGIWAAVGLHPNHAAGPQFTVQDSGDFEQLLKHPKVVAIGEVGLDYYRTPEPEKQEPQRETLRQFIRLAIQYNKPLIIHCRNAHYELPEILKSSFLNHEPAMRGVIHSFTGTWRDAKKYLDLGFFLGLNGIVTFAQQYNDVVVKTPLENIVLETDAPYLTPVPFRGQRNEPLYVREVAKKVAELRGVGVEHVMRATTENAVRLFGI